MQKLLAAWDHGERRFVEVPGPRLSDRAIEMPARLTPEAVEC